MKLIFSEVEHCYSNYTFPYVVWAIPENPGEIPALYSQGFLPSIKPKFYLTRSTRVSLIEFEPSYRNRQTLKKSESISFSISKTEDFQVTDEVKALCIECAATRFGDGVVGEERLLRIFSREGTSHIMSFFYANKIVGVVSINIFGDIAHYNFAFHDVFRLSMSIGTFMLTSTIKYFADLGFLYLYMGTCYSEKFLYKSKFKGFEFFNGFGWSKNVAELQYLVSNPKIETHLLEAPEYLHKFGCENNALGLGLQSMSSAVATSENSKIHECKEA
jgi:hypothetical protein